MLSSCSSVMEVSFLFPDRGSLLGRFSPWQDEQLLQGLSSDFWMPNHFSN